MIRFYIVRHGQTLFNQKDLVQGWCDSPLTKLGQQQAQAVGLGLKDVKFTHAYSSISERAYDTAEAILKGTGTSVTVDKRLKEFNFGTLEGEKNSALMNGRASDFTDLIKFGWVDVGGDNEEIVRTRIRQFFNDITKKHEDATILITTHGITMYAILRELVGNDKKTQDFKGTENCAVNIIEYNQDDYHLIELNNTTYRDQGLLQL